MNGKDFEGLLKKKGYNATQAISALSCSRPHFYDLIKKDVVPEQWVKLAKSLPDNTKASPHITTAAELVSTIERIRADHQHDKQELYLIIQDYRQQIEDYRKLLKLKKVLT